MAGLKEEKEEVKFREWCARLILCSCRARQHLGNGVGHFSSTTPKRRGKQYLVQYGSLPFFLL